ncbi:L-arabinokinase [Capsicum annuum]|uniref:L-arabinokinase n=1 Tax=Capsicum annuum TaxID=4072 RepID=A0A2G2Z1Q8_CAPAN|nr:L-arabinokinase [Capsicum annuum]
MDLSDFMEDGRPITYEKAYNYFARDPAQKWAAYVAGTILVLITELGIRFEDSISILVSSGVPEGKGVSSSAAIEVENHIVGAPCGVMDQMASACGEANKLLAMVCQPAEVLGLVDIPPTIRFWGIDSGIRHSVGSSDYKSVRVGAFMGRKIIKSSASQINGLNPDDADADGRNLLETEASLDYLCNLSAHRYEASYATRLPESLSGRDFVEKYLDHDDSVTTIDKECNYAVRAPTRHPIYENFRVKAFKALLSAAVSNYQLSALGELMYQCHYSYSACGLGSNGTDRLVNLVQEMQHSKSSESEGGTLFGAKITGGGSGGTICVIGRNCLRSNEQLIEIQQRYKAATGFLPYVFEGSSPGAAKFGHLQIRFRPSLTE